MELRGSLSRTPLLGPAFAGVRVQLRIDTRTNQFSKTKRLLDFRPTLPGYRATLRRALSSTFVSEGRAF